MRVFYDILKANVVKFDSIPNREVTQFVGSKIVYRGTHQQGVIHTSKYYGLGCGSLTEIEIKYTIAKSAQRERK